MKIKKIVSIGMVMNMLFANLPVRNDEKAGVRKNAAGIENKSNTKKSDSLLNFKQESFEGANKNIGIYKKYAKSLTGRKYLIPGLNEYFVPQGTAYRKDTNQIYISGYLITGENSVVMVIDAKTGEYVNDYKLYYPNGADCRAHAGGLAITKNYMYLPDGKNLYRVKLSALEGAEKGGKLQFEEKIPLAVGKREFAYCEYGEGYMWVGGFYNPEVRKYSGKETKEYNFFIYAYKLDENTKEEFNPEKRTENTSDYAYIPDMLLVIDEEKIQGAAAACGKLFLSSSYGASSSKMYIYDIPKPIFAEETYLLDYDKKVPLIKLKAKKRLIIPAMSEDLTVNGNGLWINYESGDMKHRSNGARVQTDSIWELDINKILNEN